MDTPEDAMETEPTGAGSSAWEQLARARFSLRSSQPPSAEERAFIDTEIRELERVLQAAKDLRNRRTSLGSLPDELLVYIMRLLQDTYPPGSLAIWGVTHTCRRLRALGLGCPSFWTTFSTSFLSSLTMTLPAVLPRSDNLPLSLHLRRMKSHEVAFVRNQLIGLCGSRIQTVYLEPTSVSDATVLINAFISNELSSLENLQLKIPPSWVVNVHLPASENIPPHLAKLALDGVPFKYSSPIYNNLRSLSITRPPGSLELSYYDVKDLATRMQRVELLALNHCTDVRSFADANARRLPMIKQPSSLRKFIFTSLGIRNMLMSLEPHPNVNMEVLDSTPPNKAMLSAMSAEDKGFYDPLELHVAEYMRPKAARFILRIDVSGRTVVTWSFWREVPVSGSFAASSPDFYLQRFAFHEEPFPTHFRMNVLSNLVDLSLDIEDKQLAEHWGAVLEQLSFVLTLKTLRVTERTFLSPHFAAVLHMRSQRRDDSYDLLPKLNVLEVMPHPFPTAVDEDHLLAALDELTSFLHRRATDGKPLSVLCIPAYWPNTLDHAIPRSARWRDTVTELKLL
ncbi:unnamed protein product [Peniophora sp. CBMAI 1063]|nr:unnamed protein product [Peniophora sp. CBMAI 1063]